MTSEEHIMMKEAKERCPSCDHVLPRDPVLFRLEDCERCKQLREALEKHNSMMTPEYWKKKLGYIS